MPESYKWIGLDWDWIGIGWKSLQALILRAPLCGANNDQTVMIIINPVWSQRFTSFTKLVKITLLSLLTARYDFEANKKNNLIFYGLPSDQRETPNALVTKVKHKNMRDYQPLLKDLI